MKDAVVALLGSRKFLVVCLAVIAVSVLAALGKLPVADMVSTIERLAIVLVGAIAVEGAAEKWNAPPPPLSAVLDSTLDAALLLQAPPAAVATTPLAASSNVVAPVGAPIRTTEVRRVP